MKDKIFTGDALEDALKGDAFEQADIELVGMVKSSEKTGHIAFARGDCETWVDVPTQMIDQAERLGQKKCKDHSHPHFRITLKQPSDPETSLFAKLLTVSPTNLSSSSSGQQSRSSSSTPMGYQAGSPMGYQAGSPMGYQAGSPMGYQAGSLRPTYHLAAASPQNSIPPYGPGYVSSGSYPGYSSRGISPHLGIGGGGTPIGGGGNLWNYCWGSQCCDCVPNGLPCWTDGAGVDHCPCDTVCNPCDRCIFPW